jgi:glycosyltransferase involved in cell wall biosynthesis
MLTCRLRPNDSPGGYRPAVAAALLDKLNLRDAVVELGAVPYASLHKLYGACDVYVTPAYAESFAHPLVEAMASGLPIVASDLPVHREICGRAGVFFDRFSAEDLAAKVLAVARCRELKQDLTKSGRRRALDFSWKQHVEEILVLADSLRRTKAS